jgi:hypothetical protein
MADFKHSGSADSPTSTDNGEPVRATDRQRIDPESGVKRGLKTRHLSMLALAGIIGPGLLVGAGGALSNGGPASLIIGFGVIGVIAFSIMQSLGELTTLYPSGGAFTGLADRFVDKAFGVAVGVSSSLRSQSLKTPLTETVELFYYLGRRLSERIQRHHFRARLLVRHRPSMGLFPHLLVRLPSLPNARR